MRSLILERLGLSFLFSRFKKNLLIILGLVLLGFFDSLFIFFSKINKAKSTETISCIANSKCDNVLFSDYSRIFGISLEILGMIYYFLLFLLGVFLHFYEKNFFFKLKLKEEKTKKVFFLFLKIFLTLTLGGFLFSFYLLYVQIFILKSLCFYCLFSFMIASLVFLFSIFSFKKDNNFSKE